MARKNEAYGDETLVAFLTARAMSNRLLTVLGDPVALRMQAIADFDRQRKLGGASQPLDMSKMDTTQFELNAEAFARITQTLEKDGLADTTVKVDGVDHLVNVLELRKDVAAQVRREQQQEALPSPSSSRRTLALMQFVAKAFDSVAKEAEARQTTASGIDEERLSEAKEYARSVVDAATQYARFFIEGMDSGKAQGM